MSPSTKSLRVALYVCMLMPSIYFSYYYTADFYNEAKVATVTIEESDSKSITEMLVCSPDAINESVIATIGAEAVMYALGELINIDVREAGIDIGIGGLEVEDQANWKAAFDATGQKTWEVRGSVVDLYTKDLANRSTLQKGTPYWLYENPRLLCTVVPVSHFLRFGLSGYATEAISLNRKRIFAFYLPDRTTGHNNEKQFHISFFSGEDWVFLSKARDFLPIRYRLAEGTTGKIVKTTLTIDPKHFSYLNTKSDGCAEADEGTRYPSNYKGSLCEMRCEEWAFAEYYNCSVLKTTGRSKLALNLKPCNKFTSDGPKFKVPTEKFLYEEEIIGFKSKCILEKGCQFMKSCDEYSLQYYNVETEIDTMPPGQAVSGYTQFVVEVNLQATRVVISEQLLISTEGWIGTVGGILGLWMGVSILGVVDVCVAAAKKCKGGKVDEGDAENAKM